MTSRPTRLGAAMLALSSGLLTTTEVQGQRSVLAIPNDTSQVTQTYTRYVAAALDDLGYTVERGERPDGWRSYYEVTLAVGEPGGSKAYTVAVVFNWTGIQENGMEVRSPPKVMYLQWGVNRRSMPDVAQIVAERVAARVDEWNEALDEPTP